METKYIKLKLPDGACQAYLAYPSQGTHPAVIFYMDAYGLRPWLYEMARKLAGAGYYVLMPNVFYRSPGAKTETTEQLRALVGSVTPEMAVRDAGAYLKFLGEQKEATTGKIGVTGYCMGVALALRTAAAYPEQIACAGGFHGGRLATDAPESPHLLAGKIKAELYFGHADQDASMPADQIKRLDEALDAAKVKHTTEVYRGAAHGYTMKDKPHYQEEAAERHWAALFALLERNLR